MFNYPRRSHDTSDTHDASHRAIYDTEHGVVNTLDFGVPKAFVAEFGGDVTGATEIENAIQKQLG